MTLKKIACYSIVMFLPYSINCHTVYLLAYQFHIMMLHNLILQLLIKYSTFTLARFVSHIDYRTSIHVYRFASQL